MKNTSPKVDEYINRAAPFAQLILTHLRNLVHQACPEVVETIKWGMPSFEYKGPYFGFAAFKQHCVGVFWKHKLIHDPTGYLRERKNQGGEAMGNLGRMTTMEDLPPDDILLDFFEQARRLNDEGIKVVRKPPQKNRAIIVPDELKIALFNHPGAQGVFENFSPSHKLEYIEWIQEAKTEITRQKRIDQTIEWLQEGKPRNWKYMRK